MNRRRIVRIQVALLVLVTFLVLIRLLGVSDRPAGVVVLDDLEPFTLRSSAFDVESAASVEISATGSVERRGARADTALAAYAWLLDAESRDPIWVMHAGNSRRGNGLLVHVDTTLDLPAGRYEAYFTSYGNRLSPPSSRSFFNRIFDDTKQWTSDAGRWHFLVRQPQDAPGKVARVGRVDDDEQHVAAGTIWSSGPVRNRQVREQLLRVERPARVQVYSIGEMGDSPDDFGWIRRAGSDQEVWSLDEANSIPAGGAAENRLSRVVLDLEPGYYSVGYRSDGGHAYGGWRGNPPFDPRGWGLTLTNASMDDDAVIRPFDPWESLTPIVSLTRVRDDENRAARFRVDREVPVVIYSLGEIGRSQYDYGWLESTEGGEMVWEMQEERAAPAGGHENNRREVAFVEMEAGEYRLQYETDGSHAFGDFRNGEPDHPERWGVTLFVLNAGDADAVELLEQDEPAPVDAAPPAPPPPPSAQPSGSTIVDLTGIGSDQRVRRSFSLESTTDVYVRALGEITLSNRYDYGWIEQQDGGERIWEMTYGNTTEAGGDSRNRMFEGVIKLPPGSYVVGFETDFSHAANDFRSQAERPPDPDAWGILLRRQQ